MSPVWSLIAEMPNGYVIGATRTCRLPFEIGHLTLQIESYPCERAQQCLVE